MKPQGALRPDPDLPSGGLLRLQSRAEQLADYLRAQWQRGALQEPLPGSRDWSRKLGVSRSTLDAALKLLAHEKWLEVTGRGVCLRRQQPDGSRRRRPAVKWLLEGTSQPVAHNYLAVAAMVQNRLRLKGIEVDWEVCSPGRIREIARHPVRDRLHILASLRPAFQCLFSDAGQPALVLGEVAAGLDLPFINVDLSGAVRHAVFELLRTGCTR